MKGGTANAINQHRETQGVPLRWAEGYSVTSVSPRQLAPAEAYVRNQQVHHPHDAIPGWSGRAVTERSMGVRLRAPTASESPGAASAASVVASATPAES
jgi:hypothetical protein